ncbi:MAG: STAS domain-containing protein [Phycisphaerales bacterium]|nr:STAS domain-containing protein [Phycisphaerales bacterium]
MRIETNRHGAVSVVRPDGPVINGDDAALLKNEAFSVLGETLGRFVIDTTEMTFVDSCGLEALVDITDEVGAGGHQLKLCGVSETLREILMLTGLTSKFQQYEDVQSAVRSFL